MIENNNNEPLLSVIKIGRVEYKIKKNDYIMYNGSCYQFCTGDHRELKFERYTSIHSIVIPSSTMKKIPLDKMKKQNYTQYGMELVKWLF